MAFTRKQMASAVAGTLSLAMLTGCPAAPTQPVGAGSPTPAAGGTATTTPATTAPGGTATASPAAGESPATTPSGAVASAPAPSNKKVVVSGFVYDEDGAPVDGAVVKVTSLDTSVPYTASAKSEAGSFVLNDVPEGANVELVASKDGWTQRRRVGSFQAASTNKNIVYFGTSGGTSSDDDNQAAGRAYFISKYPEIMKTEPAEDATNVDPSTTTIKLTLSEALDATNRRRFEDAVRVLPANEFAAGEDSDASQGFYDFENKKDSAVNVATAGGQSVTDFSDNADYDSITGDGAFAYSLDNDSLFLDDSATKTKVSWNADNTEMTLTFNAPLIANDNDQAKYNIALVAASNDAIEDADGNQLGQDSDAQLDSWPGNDQLIFHAFKEVDLSIEGGESAPEDDSERWAQTHDNTATFEVKEDDTDPVLTGVEVNETGDDTRFELTFSEPMAAFNGQETGYSASILQSTDFLDNDFSFAVDETADDLKDVDLDGDVGTTGADIITLSGTNNERSREQRIPSATFDTGKADDNSAGEVTIEVDPTDAKRVFVTIVGVQDLFDDEINAIKARVEGVADPAGNGITASQADKNQVTGSI